MIDIKAIIEKPENLRYYKGQVYEVDEVGIVEPKYYDIEKIGIPYKNILKVLLSNLQLSHLYQHQGLFIKEIADGKDAYLCLAPGSGSSMAVDLAVVATILTKHRTALYLRPSTYDLRSRLAVVNDRIKQMRWDWLVKAEKADCIEEFCSALGREPDIIITAPEVFKEYFLTKFSVEEGSTWMDALLHVVIEEITMFHPEELFHLSNLISSLIIERNNSIQFLLTSAPVGSPEKFARNLTHRNCSVITSSYSGNNRFKILYWIPQIVAKVDDDTGEIQVFRENFFEELKGCFKIFCRSEDNILVWNLIQSFSSADYRLLKEDLLRSVQLEIPKLEITICGDISEIPRDKFKKFNRVFVLGTAPIYKNIKQILSNLITENGLAIIIANEDPLSFFFVRRLDMVDKLRLPDIIIPQNKSVTEFYFFRTLASKRINSLGYEQLISVWGKELTEEILSQLVQEKLIEKGDGRVYVLDRDKIYDKQKDIPWGIMDKNFYELSTSSQEIYSIRKFVTESLFPYIVYPEAVIYNGLEKYQISSSFDGSFDGDKCKLNYATEHTPVLTVPIINHLFSSKHTEPIAYKEIKGLGRLELLPEQTIEIQFCGFKYFLDFKFQNTGEVKVKPISRIRKTSLIKFNTDSSAGIAQIWNIFLPYFFHNFERLIAVFSDESAVYIIPLVDSGNEVLKEIYEGMVELLNLLYEYGYELLISCPCSDGCPLCIEYKKTNVTLKGKKHDILLTIGQALGKESETKKFLIYKSEGLDADSAQKQYEAEQKRIIGLFRNKLGLEIQKPARITVDNLDKKLLGFCSSEGGVKVIPKIPQALAIQVIAHEYAHNWEFEQTNSNVLKEKIISEGFAEWVAFKILEFYGLLDYIGKIKLRDYDEYGKGFNLCKRIEDEIAGFLGVIEFVKTGIVRNPLNNEEYDLARLMEEGWVYYNK